MNDPQQTITFVLLIIECINCQLLQVRHQNDDVTKHDCHVTGCLNNGRCQQVEEVRINGGGRLEIRGRWRKCACPLGWMGIRCEEGISTKFPRFHGNGFMRLQGLPNTAFQQLEMVLEIKPETDNGLILSGNVGSLHNDVTKDFFSLSIVDGFLIFRFDCGGGVNEVKSDEKFQRKKWNVLQIRRMNKLGSLKLNDGDEKKVRSKGSYSKVSLGKEFYLGGHPNVTSIGGLMATKHGLVGCVRRLFVDGRRIDMRRGDGYRGDASEGWNVESCTIDKSDRCLMMSCFNGGSCVHDDVIDEVTCWCPLGFGGYNCQIDVTTLGSVPRFQSNSFMKFISPHKNSDSLKIEIKLRSSSDRGIVCYLGDGRNGDFMLLALNEAFVEVSFNLGGGTTILRSKKQLLMNEWHTLQVHLQAKKVELNVDFNNPSSTSSYGSFVQMTLNSHLYIGGHPNPDDMHKDVYDDESFLGCIEHVIIGNTSLKILEEAIDGRNVERCSNVCSGGFCTQGEGCLEEENGSFICI